MSFVRHLVLPKLPTTLTNDTQVDLPGHDTLFKHINQVHVIVTELDVSKFKDALARVLQLYPHASGQLRHTDNRWFIALTNTAVPVDVDYRLNTSSESLFDGNWVIQDDLSKLLNEHPIGANVVNSDAPLLRFKLTLFDHETCIGVSWSHSLGDAIVISRLMHILSQFYQDLPAQFAAPTFEKHHFPTPSPSIVAELSSHTLLYRIRHFDEAAHIESRKDVKQVRWRFDNDDLEELRSALGSDGQNKFFLSKQDCLTAYLVAVLNHNNRSSIRAVNSYRHINHSFIAQNTAGNLLVIVSAIVPKDMAGIAYAIRHALIQSRKPHYLYILELLKCAHMLEAANTGKLLPFSFEADDLFVNSNGVIDWCSADFGCSRGTRFHTHGVFKNVLRCFRSNPVKGDDGVWRVRQSIDISMGVSAELEPRIMETLTRGIQYMLAEQCVQ